MGIHTNDAIILRKKDVRETSLLLVFYTRDFGKIKGLIKGARGPRGPLGYQAQIFTLNRIVFYDSRRSGIHTVSQCDLLDFFEGIRVDILKTGYACYFAELIDALTEDGDRNEEIYDLLLNSLELLKGSASPKRISRILEIKLLMIAGLMPRLDKCVLCGAQIDFKDTASNKARFSYKSGGLICKACFGQDSSSRSILPGTTHFIDHVERAPYEKASRIKVSKDVGVELEDIMENFLRYQLDRQIKSLDFLEKVQKGLVWKRT
jgi:DNA repair protein RecO (recombination protein O)